MLIENIHLESFGKYKNRKFDLSPGINVIYGENESGKSTIHRFLESILEDELSKTDVSGYRPWNDGDIFKGSIELVEGMGRVVISKDFNEGTTTQSAMNVIGEIKNGDVYEQPLTSLSSYKFSNFAGNALVSELKARISNKTTTNSENLDALNILNHIEEDLLKYRVKNQSDIISEEQIRIDENAEDIKKIHYEQKLLYKQNRDLTLRLEAINEGLINVEAMLEEEKYRYIEEIEEKIKDNNREIEKMQSKLNSLEKYIGIDIDSYEDYLKIINEKQQIQEKIVGLEEGMVQDNSLSNREEEALHRGLKFIRNKEYYEAFLYEIRQYKRMQKGIEDIINDISLKKKNLKEKYEENPIDINTMEREYLEAKFSENVNDINQESEDTKGVDEIDALMKKRRKLAFIGGVSLLIGAFLLVFSHMILPETQYIVGVDIGIGLILLGLVSGYFMFNNQSKISQLEFVNNYMKQRENQEGESYENQGDMILKKYNCQSIEELEDKIYELKEQVQFVQLSSTQIDILEAEHGKQKANLVTIRSNIESRMLQCEFTSAFEQGAIDDVEDELESLRNTYIELNQSKEEAAVMAEEVVNLKKVLDDFEGELDNEQYAIFKELTYAEIYELKKEYYDILNKIKDIEDENGSLPESENKSTTYNRLIEDRYNLLEEKLQNELVLMTILNQTTDNEHLINKLLERERQFKLLLQENKLLQDKINVIETAKSYIEMGVKEVQVSLYPILNDNMNKMLASITNKYNKLEIQDDGQIALYHDNNQKVYLRDLSLGTIDQIYFIIGICLIEGLYDSSKSIPIILDDAFVQYDYDRFKNVMEIIEKLDRQIIIFSCYEREYEYLTANNKVFNYINLSEDVEF